VTAGVRYSLYSPPYEVNGLQVQPTISMGEWFNRRGENMQNGIPSSASPVVSFDLAGPKNNRPGFYAGTRTTSRRACRSRGRPRRPKAASGAGSPAAERLVVRGGYSKVFDRVGQGLANNFDEGFAFGMSTTLSSPFGLAYERTRGCASPNSARCRRPCPPRRRRLPADAAARRRHHHDEHRRHPRDAVGAHGELRRRPRPDVGTSRSRPATSAASAAICSFAATSPCR
jgi:hypothetical protein